MNDLDALVKISKYAGERFDLVQAGGGNSSVKQDDGTMLIKASGFLLSDLDASNGYSRVITKQIADIVKDETIINETNKREREILASNLVKSATIDKNNRPSIETLLHSFLLKYTLHTHPIVVNMIVAQRNWKDILVSIFGDEEIALIEYKTPGIELALILAAELRKFKTIPNIIFLQNHGLIVTSIDNNEIKTKTEYVLQKIENYLKVDMKRYKTTNKITYLFSSIEENTNISYLSEDKYLNEMIAKNKALFSKTPFCPDSLVYSGINCVEIKTISDISSIQNYKNTYYELPKVVIFENNLYFIAQNIKKAKEIEEVFKFHIMVLENNRNNINYLEVDELAYLSNWEAEQYRRKV